MRITRINGYTKLWLSARDTGEWASRPGAQWPCSEIAGKYLFAEFEPNGDLVDMEIDCGRGRQDVNGAEFNAITSDYLETLDPGHPGIRRAE